MMKSFTSWLLGENKDARKETSNMKQFEETDKGYLYTAPDGSLIEFEKPKKIVTKTSKEAAIERKKNEMDTKCPECGTMSIPMSRQYPYNFYRCCNKSCRCEWKAKS